MANILLVDHSEMARKALKGILVRGNHRLMAVDTAAEAWDFIWRNAKIDLVIVELNLEGDSGLAFIQRLRDDPLLDVLPVVVYTGSGNRDTVRRCVELRVQNFLVKPYREEAVFTEVAKTLANPWRQVHFEDEASFCAMAGCTADGLRKALENLRTNLVLAVSALHASARAEDLKGATDRLNELAAAAEAAGAWGVVDCVELLRDRAVNREWSEFSVRAATLEFASRIILYHLNPSLVPEGFLSEGERQAKEEKRARAEWFDAPAQNRCPVVAWPQLEQQLEALAGCPIIDSVAAQFQMQASGHPSSLVPLMDQVDKDPGLAAQVIIAANQVRRMEADDPEPIDNPQLCVSRLGENRLTAIARSLVTTEERRMHLPPWTWPRFWMFQIGVARMAGFTCSYLELPGMETRAHTAGLLHDLGKLLLLHLHPHAFAAVLDYAHRLAVPLAEAEKKFLGCTTPELAAHFAAKRGLPKAFCNVMRWVADPAQATEDAELVAVVSFARHLCLQNHVGYSGDVPKKQRVSFADTPEWKILGPSVYPSFNLKKFEAQAHAQCRELRQELHGRLRIAQW